MISNCKLNKVSLLSNGFIHTIRTIVLAIFVITRFQCAIGQEAVGYVTECDSFLVNEFFKISESNINEPRFIFEPKTPLKCSPDDASEVLDTLIFNTQVMVLGRIQRFVPDTLFSVEVATGKKSMLHEFLRPVGDWYKVVSGSDTGFVEYNDVAIHRFADDGILGGVVEENNNEFLELRKYETNKIHVITGNFRFEMWSHGHELKIIDESTLTNCDRLYHFQTYRQSCPGMIFNEFVVLNENGFIKLITGLTSGEGGDYDEIKIYIPIKGNDRVVLLVENGDKSSLEKSELLNNSNVFTCPEGIEIPFGQLIIKTREFTELIEVLTSDEEEIEEIEPTYNVIKVTPEFYYWDGEKLILQN